MDSSSDDELIDGVGKFIEIAPFNPKDIDLSKPPTNGEEFLQRVIIEAKSVKPRSIQIDRSIHNQDDEMKMDTSISAANETREIDSEKLPTKEWCSEQINVFRDLRNKADTIKQEIIKSGNVQMINMELISNEDQCYQFISSNQPTQTLLKSMSQVALDTLLENLCDWITSEKCSIQSLGRWIYAALVYLDIPLLPEMHHNLRTIAKHCITQRSQVDNLDVESLATFNLFITLISIYFRQSDLADSILV